MRTFKLFAAVVSIVAVTAVSSALAQDWQGSYAEAVSLAKESKWLEARAAFQASAEARPSDQAAPTRLPGPITEPKFWNNKAPYSAKFGAAYSAYRLSMESSNADEKGQFAVAARDEFKALLDAGQCSPTTVHLYLLAAGITGSTVEKPTANEWKVDLSFVQAKDLPREVVTSAQSGSSTVKVGDGTGQGAVVTSGVNGQIVQIKASSDNNIEEILHSTPLEVKEDKYAIVVGNDAAKFPTGGPSSSTTDAEAIRDGLVNFAGYKADHVKMLVNVTAKDFHEAAKALAAEIPDDATVLIYFSGAATHLAGRDYFAGADAQLGTDTTKMVEKLAIVQPFLNRGARLFLFSQVNRTIVAGNYFGQERILAGQFSESHSTIPGGLVYNVVEGGKPIGLYTSSFVKVLKQFYTNEVPVTEFCWHVYYMMRRGSDFRGAGGSTQTPTLPVIINMSDASAF